MTLLSTSDLRRIATDDLRARADDPLGDPRVVLRLSRLDLDMEAAGLCLGTVFERVAFTPAGDDRPYVRTSSTVFVDAVTGEVVPLTLARHDGKTTVRCGAFLPEDAAELVEVALAARADYVRVVPATGDARASVWLMVDEVVHLWRYLPDEFHGRLVANLASDRTGPSLATRSTSGRVSHVHFDRMADGRVDATLVLSGTEKDSVASEMARRYDAITTATAPALARAGEDLDRGTDDAKLSDLGARVEAGRRAAVSFVPDPEAVIDRLGSFALGRPAWPSGAAWPSAIDGKPLFFLAQVACADLRSLPDFPHDGLLQFFVLDEDYGMDPGPTGGVPGGFRVVWHASTDYDADDAVAPMEAPTGPLPFDHARGPVALVPKETSMTEGTGECSFDENNPGFEAGYGVERSALLEENGPTHYAGGWPRTVRGDLRFGREDVVLMRFGSDTLLRWGNEGTAHFTIARADLAARDFAASSFEWDDA